MTIHSPTVGNVDHVIIGALLCDHFSVDVVIGCDHVLTNSLVIVHDAISMELYLKRKIGLICRNANVNDEDLGTDVDCTMASTPTLLQALLSMFVESSDIDRITG